MALSSKLLLGFPTELILEVADHLPLDGILALKLTHPILNDTLSLASRFKNTTLTNCARLAIRTYLARPNVTSTHRRCILCKQVYPVSLFSSSSSPACAPISFTEDVQQTEVVELPHRLCSWHVGRLARIIHTEPSGRNGWVSRMDKMCMHCGTIQSWVRCDCRCDSCFFSSVRTYTRYLNNKTECKRFVFWKETASSELSVPRKASGDQLFVRETCWDAGEYWSARDVRTESSWCMVVL